MHKIERKLHLVRVQGRNGYSIVKCESYFLDHAKMFRGFEFQQLFASLPPVPQPSAGILTFTQELRGGSCLPAAESEADPSVPFEDVVRRKMIEAYGADVTVEIVELDLTETPPIAKNS